MAEIKQKLKTPSVPNFIMIESPVGRKQDGFSESPKIAVGDLPDETLEEIAREWRLDLLEKALHQRMTSDANAHEVDKDGRE